MECSLVMAVALGACADYVPPDSNPTSNPSGCQNGIVTCMDQRTTPPPTVIDSSKKYTATVHTSRGDFTITFTEIPGKEPLLYYSMNDVLPEKTGTAVSGVKGRATKFDGKKTQVKLDIKASDLKQGATIEFWTQAANPDAKDQAVPCDSCRKRILERPARLDRRYAATRENDRG